MRLRHLCAAIVLALLAAAPARAQDDPDLARRANAAFFGKDWEAARAAYATLAQGSPQSGLYAFRLGVALLSVGQPAEALKQLERAESLGWAKPQIAFRRAGADARLGDRDAAFRELDVAAKAGFGIIALLDSDEHLASLRSDPRWKAAHDAVDKNAHPCLHDAKYRELDFWIGTWDVRPNGAPESQPPASSVIAKEHDGCVIHENWNAPGSTGQSFNIYDSSRGKWYQTWVDNSGGLHEYSGNLDGGNMVYLADLAPAPGQTGRVHTRMTFFNLGPNKVRQLGEATSDGGNTWTTNYDLIYVRRSTAN